MRDLSQYTEEELKQQLEKIKIEKVLSKIDTGTAFTKDELKELSDYIVATKCHTGPYERWRRREFVDVLLKIKDRYYKYSYISGEEWLDPIYKDTRIKPVKNVIVEEEIVKKTHYKGW